MRPGTAFRFVVVSGLLVLGARAEDWPTYQHDAARSGVTSERLAFPLQAQWTFVPTHPPQAAWPGPKRSAVEGILEEHKVRFDDAFQVAVADGAVYFGSSADNKVYALDAATGAVRWTAFTGAPVRLAPTAWKDRVFAGADDGFAYCFRAEDGKQVWKFRAAPADDRALGHGRMMSLWPVRTGVLVDGGVAYFGAGLFPAQGVYLYAVNAKDGALLWRNDSFGRPVAGGWQPFSPQGYLLASSARVYAPCGRATAAAFDRQDGRFLFQPPLGDSVGGGTDALLAGDQLFAGANIIIAYDQATGKTGGGYFGGRRLVAAPDTFYLAKALEILALDRAAYPPLSRKHQAARVKLDVTKAEGNYALSRRKSALAKDIKDHQDETGFLGRQMEGLDKSSSEWKALKSRSDALARAIETKTAELESVSKQLAQAVEELKALASEEKKTRADADACITWRTACECNSALILAGTALLAGGKDTVVAMDAAIGRQLWTGKVDGDARGLAVADGRLFVSTDKGAIHCFGAGGGIAALVRPALEESPYPTDKLTPVYAAAAERIVKATGVRRGYCLVLKCGTGRLAYELAKRTDLMIYGVEPDERKAEAARRRLDSAGLYGVRVTVDTGGKALLPYPDYFANLVVSDAILTSGEPEGSPKEMFRTLRPCGGVALIGQPAESARGGGELKVRALREWMEGAGGPTVDIAEDGGVWGRITRSPLQGAGRWTHQFADPANTGCSGDQLLQGPLGVLWFGRPGPDKVVNRHSAGAGPLALNGRFIVQGTDLVMAYDAYNGTPLWERQIPGAARAGLCRECSNLAATDNGVWVAAKGQCFRLDWENGEVRHTYDLPPATDGKLRRWGYVACADGTLFGSRTERGVMADGVLALDAENGKLRWVHEGKRIGQATIAVGGGRVFLVENDVTPAHRAEALRAKAERLKELKGSEAFRLEKEIKAADVRLVVALDAKTGQAAWEKPLDLTDCGGPLLSTLYHDGLVILCGAFPDGHLWSEFHAGVLSPRRVTVLAAADGAPVWSKALGYRTRPLVNGDTIYADPWGFDLRTGERKMRVHPVTGDVTPFEFGRGHHCGPATASRNMLFMRSLTSAYYDLAQDSGTIQFGGHRPGCAVNMISADGLLIEPEASSGCVCPFAVQSTLVLKPGKVDRAWGAFCSQVPAMPVQHLAVSFGAPGDRRDDHGTLWLAYPRPNVPLVLKLGLGVSVTAGGGYFHHEPETLGWSEADAPWRFASGCCGLTKCTIPLVGPDDGDALYTVRLGFARSGDDRRGRRVFDVKLMGQVVQQKFDVAERVAPNETVVREFRGIPVSGDLTFEFVPAVKNPPRDQAPIVNWVEVVRTRVLHAGLAIPSFLLSDAQPEQAGEVTIANRQDAEFGGTLRVKAPTGFQVTPETIAVRVAPGKKQTIALQAAVLAKGQPCDAVADIELLTTDGTLDTKKRVRIQYLGRFQQIVCKAVEDASVVRGTPQARGGTGTQLSVDGGDKTMGDAQHTVSYLKFRLDVLGKPVSCMLRLRVPPNEWADSSDAGLVCLVEETWSEKEITYETRPKAGKEIGRLGRVAVGEVVERPLQVDLVGRKELSVALEPTNCDGAAFYSRRGAVAPELVVLYEP